MGRPLDKDASETEAPAADERPGRVEFDSRGNSVWRWARDVLDSTSILLKRLENKDLALEPTQKVRVVRGAENPRAHAKPGKAASAPVQGPGRKVRSPELDVDSGDRNSSGGFDPYNSR